MEEDQGDICRVCHVEGLPGRPLLHPCHCDGSMKWIHQNCLLAWMEHSKINNCDICGYQFLIEPVYRSDMPKRLPFKDIMYCLGKSLMITSKKWLRVGLFVLIGGGILVGGVILLQMILELITMQAWNFYVNTLEMLTSLQIICSSGDEDVKSCLLVPNNKNSEIFFRSFIVFLKLFAFRKFLWLLERYGWLSQVVRPPNIEQNGPADDAEGVAVRANLGNILTWCCWTAIYWKVLYIMLYLCPLEIGLDVIALALLLGAKQNVILFGRTTGTLWGYCFIMFFLLMMTPFKFKSYLRNMKRFRRIFQGLITFEKISSFLCTCMKAFRPCLLFICMIPIMYGILVELAIDLSLQLPYWQLALFDGWKIWYRGLAYAYVDFFVTISLEYYELGIAVQEFAEAKGREHEQVNKKQIGLCRLIKLMSIPITSFSFALVIQRFVSSAIIPMVVGEIWIQGLIADLMYPLILLVYFFKKSVIHKFKETYEQRKNYKYLVGYEVLNYEKIQSRN